MFLELLLDVSSDLERYTIIKSLIIKVFVFFFCLRVGYAFSRFYIAVNIEISPRKEVNDRARVENH